MFDLEPDKNLLFYNFSPFLFSFWARFEQSQLNISLIRQLPQERR